MTFVVTWRCIENKKKIIQIDLLVGAEALVGGQATPPSIIVEETLE